MHDRVRRGTVEGIEELETFYDLNREGGQLVIRHRRFGPVTLTHTSGDSFSGTLPVSQLVFSRDAEGKVTGFEAGNGRARGIVFKKVGDGAAPTR